MLNWTEPPGSIELVDESRFQWPFLDDGHRAEAEALSRWAERASPSLLGHAGDDPAGVDACVAGLVRELGSAGLLRACVPEAYGGAREKVDTRSLCIARETLAQASGLADFAFGMQALGSVPVSLFGREDQKRAILPATAQGTRIGAFALSEPDAGSDAAAIATTATPVPGGYRLDGTKAWISNAGIASQYVVFARTGRENDPKGVSAFLVDADTPGLDASERIDVIAPHPLGLLRLSDCRVGSDALLGEPGQGFKIAMATLDVMRSTVGAAALGFARHAFSEAVQRARKRRMFGRTLIDMQITQARLGEMALAIDASALLIYRAAWTRDVLGARVTREASMAKLHATEAAQQVIDAAVQIFGGLGVVRGMPVERLYREIRALRIYEGASEVLKLVVAERAIDALRERPRRAT